MPVTHEPWLVALSVVVAIQGAYVGLTLSRQVAEAAGLTRRLLLAAAALSLAVAIWSMHFVGMLAARLPFPVDYLVFPTLLSFLVCALVVGGAVFAASSGPPTAARLSAAALFMGGGIASMHYLGMTALHASAHLSHDPRLVAASVAVAVAASGLALWLARGLASGGTGRQGGRRRPLLPSAAALGLAIAAMHYTAMAGLRLDPYPHPETLAPALSSDLLAIVVAVVAFLVSGLFLLTLVPDPRPARSPAAEPVTGARAETVADSAGLPPHKADRLPIEVEGKSRSLAVEAVFAVQANAHYTYLFDGSAQLFCPLAIGEVEARLDPERFLRVHRSHIIDLRRVAQIRRAGDHGLVELAAAQPYCVPVARARLSRLKAQLRASGDGEAAGAVPPAFAGMHHPELS